MTDTPFVCVEPPVPPRWRSLATTGGAARRFWRTGAELRVLLLDIPQLTRRVLESAAAWTEYANLSFRPVVAGPAEIRVTFRGDGNWSAWGTDAVLPELYPLDGPTMCLAELPVAMSSLRVDRVVRHAFGHALGLTHEQTGLTAAIRSVMGYASPRDRALPENAELSAADRDVVRRIYPGRS